MQDFCAKGITIYIVYGLLCIDRKRLLKIYLKKVFPCPMKIFSLLFACIVMSNYVVCHKFDMLEKLMWVYVVNILS